MDNVSLRNFHSQAATTHWSLTLGFSHPADRNKKRQEEIKKTDDSKKCLQQFSIYSSVFQRKTVKVAALFLGFAMRRCENH